MKEKKGFLLLAIGHHIYGNYAFKCALSLKYSDPTCQIALVCNNTAISQLDENEMKIFDKIIDVEYKHFHNGDGEKDYMLCKLWLYELSPFKETIFIDADTLSLVPRGIGFNALWKEISKDKTKHPFKAQCYEHSQMNNNIIKSSYFYWHPPTEIADYYKLWNATLPQLSTTIMYWRDCKQVKKLFATARELYYDPKKPLRKRVANNLPDEYFMNIACAKLKHDIPRKSYVHFHHIHGRMGGVVEDRIENIRKIFYFMTVGGDHLPFEVIENYNKLMFEIGKGMGIGKILTCDDKKDAIIERKGGGILTYNRLRDMWKNTFDAVYVINLDKRTDRLGHITELLKKIGIEKWERFSAIEPEEGNGRISKGMLGCFKSHQAIIKLAKEREQKQILILEDDVDMNLNLVGGDGLPLCARRLFEYIYQAPRDWDMLYFGGLHILRPNKHGASSYRVWQTLSTHMTAIKYTMFDAILELEHNSAYDVKLSQIQQQFNVFCPNPENPIAWQLPGFSDVENRETDHSLLKGMK